MPLTPKGEKIKSAMEEQYGPEKGESVFYASKNKGTISGVDGRTAMGDTRDYGTKEGAAKRSQGGGGSKFTLPAKTMPGGTGFTGYSDPGSARPPRHTAPKAEYKGYGDKKSRDAELTAGTPRVHKDLLGEVSTPESTPRGPMTEAKAPERNKKSGDASKAKDQTSESVGKVQSGAPMNNLGMGIPSPKITSTPGTKDTSTGGGGSDMPSMSSPGASTGGMPGMTTGDSLRSMNQANRAFWSRRR